MAKLISRRDFLKGTAAGAAAATAANVLGSFGVTAFAADEAKLETKYCNGYDNAAGIGIVSEPDSTEEADIVCVGSGIAGFMASMKLDALPENKRPAACIGCGACAKMCPQLIEIPQILHTFAERLAQLPTWAQICRQRDEAARKLREARQG